MYVCIYIYICIYTHIHICITIITHLIITIIIIIIIISFIHIISTVQTWLFKSSFGSRLVQRLNQATKASTFLRESSEQYTKPRSPLSDHLRAGQDFHSCLTDLMRISFVRRFHRNTNSSLIVNVLTSPSRPLTLSPDMQTSGVLPTP